MTPSRRKLVLTIHIASAVALLGSSFGLLITAVRAATRSEQDEAHALYGLMRLLTFSSGIPFSFVALAAGVVLALTSSWRLLRHWWVTAKLALLLVTILTGALVTGPSIDTMLDATGRGGTGEDDAQWTVVASLGAQLTMVLLAIVLAVFKLGGLTPWARPGTAFEHD